MAVYNLTHDRTIQKDILGAGFVAVFYHVPLGKAREVGHHVVTVQLGARSLADDARPVLASKVLQPRAYLRRDHHGAVGTPRAVGHHLA